MDKTFKKERSMAKAVLFLHGFLGSETQFRPFYETVRECGWEMCSLTLPGHGQDIRFFRAHGKTDWLLAVESKLASLKKEYDELLIAGHSMGGLLAILAAEKSPGKIRGILALMPPLKVHLTRRALSLYLRVPRPAKKQEPSFLRAARESLGVKINGYTDAFSLLGGVRDLYRLMDETKKKLSQLRVPLLTVHSRSDEIVSPRSMELFRRDPNAQTHFFTYSSHFCFEESELVLMQKMLKGLLF